MTKFKATIQKFGKKGEKTGWSYILIPTATAQKINKGVRTIYRVKGKLDATIINQIALLPLGEGDFILPLNASLKKAIGKQKGAELRAELELDNSPIVPPPDLMECLHDEPAALKYFNSLPGSHRNYFTKWIGTAKTDATRTKRIALVIKTMERKMDFGAMLKQEREERKKLMG